MRALLASALVLLLAAAAGAQPRGLTVGAEHASVSSGYADGRALSARLFLPRDGGWLRVSASAEDRFGEQALVYGVDAAQDLSGRWLVIGGVGSSTAGQLYPVLAASAGVGRKWGETRQLLTTAVVSLRDARDVHRDLDLTAEAAYFTPEAIVQLGGRLTESQPGDALGYGAHAAVTLLNGRGREVELRLGGGKEAYLLVEPAILDVAFRSAEAWAEWREPVGGAWGVSLRAGLYTNPYYTRVGVRTGLTRRF